MLVDLNVTGKSVYIIGQGPEAERRAVNFIEGGSKVTLIAEDFTSKMKILSKKGALKLERLNVNMIRADELEPRPDLLVAVTCNRELDRELAVQARKVGIIAYAVDQPSVSDFSQPAISRVGEFRIAISTGGKSPAVAKVLRKRIERMIKNEDILQVKLQDHCRRIVVAKVSDFETRKRILYGIMRNLKVRRLLQRGKLEKAIVLAEGIIRTAWSKAK